MLRRRKPKNLPKNRRKKLKSRRKMIRKRSRRSKKKRLRIKRLTKLRLKSLHLARCTRRRRSSQNTKGRQFSQCLTSWRPLMRKLLSKLT